MERLLITRFPLESGWGGEEELHILLADLLKKNGVQTELWSSCSQFLQGFRKKKNTAWRAFFVPDPTSKWSLVLTPITASLLLFQGFVALSIFRIRGCSSVLMLSFFEKCFLTPLALLLGYRVIWAHHAPLGKWFFQNPLLFLWKLWSKKVKIIVPSKAMKEEFKEAKGGLDISVIPNAVRILPHPDKEFQKKLLNSPLKRGVRGVKKVSKRHIIGTAGRLAPEKNLNDVLEIAKSFPDHTFLIAGDGLKRERLQKKITEEKILNAHLLGQLEKKELSAFYSVLDIFLTCTKYETFGLSLAEAGSFGVPSIAPKIGGIPDVVIDQKTGLLYEPGNIDSAKEKLRQFLDQPEKRKELGKNAKILSERFGVERYGDKMRKVLFGELKISSNELDVDSP